MHEFTFDKATAAKQLRALRKGRPVTGVRTVSDAVTLAAVALYLASTGRVAGPQEGPGLFDPRQPREHREAEEDAVHHNLVNATRYFSYLASRIDLRDYDDLYGPQVTTRGYFDGQSWRIDTVSGFKPTEG